MSLELGLRVTFSVEFILEVRKEFLKGIQSGADSDVRNDNRGFEDSLEACLIFHFNNSLADGFGNLRAHRLRYFGSFFPENIDCLLLSLTSIGTHVELEVLIDQKLQISPSFTEQMRPRPGLLLQDNVG